MGIGFRGREIACLAAALGPLVWLTYIYREREKERKERNKRMKERDMNVGPNVSY